MKETKKKEAILKGVEGSWTEKRAENAFVINRLKKKSFSICHNYLQCDTIKIRCSKNEAIHLFTVRE